MPCSYMSAKPTKLTQNKGRDCFNILTHFLWLINKSIEWNIWWELRKTSSMCLYTHTFPVSMTFLQWMYWFRLWRCKRWHTGVQLLPCVWEWRSISNIYMHFGGMLSFSRLCLFLSKSTHSWNSSDSLVSH